MATIATDDQKFTQLFASADVDKVPVGDATPAVTVQIQDANGNDLSKWVTATADPANPLLFTYERVQDDGSQPAQIDFVAIGSITVGDKTESITSALSFVPGVAAGLTATTSIVPLVDPAADSAAKSAAA